MTFRMCCVVFRSRWCQSRVRTSRLARRESRSLPASKTANDGDRARHGFRTAGSVAEMLVATRSARSTLGSDPAGEPTLPNPARVYVPVARYREHKQPVGDQTERHGAQQPRSEGLLGQRLQRPAEAPGLLRIVLERRADEERPHDTEDDPPRGDTEASPAFGPSPCPLPISSSSRYLRNRALYAW